MRFRQWKRILGSHHFDNPAILIGTAVSAVVDTARQALPSTRTPAPISWFGGRIRGMGGVWFHARPRTDDLYTLLPRRERDVHDAILDPLAPGDTFVDVGANVGYYSVHAWRRVAPSGKVVAVEAWAATAQALRRNLDLNDASGVRVVEVAVVEDRTVQRVAFRQLGRAYGLGHIIPTTLGAPTVQALTLDDVCAGIEEIDVMKVDIEGAELTALSGGRKALSRTRRLVVECADKEAVRRFLVAQGFVVEPLTFSSHLMATRPT